MLVMLQELADPNSAINQNPALTINKWERFLVSAPRRFVSESST